MLSERKYFTLNRKREWQRAFLVNLKSIEHEIFFDVPKETGSGALFTGLMITASIDSTEQDFFWQSLRLDMSLPGNSVFKVSCYSSDQMEVVINKVSVNLNDYLLDPSIEPLDKAIALEELFVPAFTGGADVSEGLLRQKGRYIWLRLEFMVPAYQGFSLRKIKLLMTDEKIIDYLPAIYRDYNPENDFFHRFIEIFDSIFFEIEDKIDRISEFMDYKLAKGKMLEYLANWMSIEDSSGLDEEKLRNLITSCITEYKTIGTVGGLESFIWRELGVKPRIIEYFNYKQMLQEGADRDLFKELFGNNPYKFFILLPEDVAKTRNMAHFQKSLNNVIPAHTEGEIILLKKGTVLGKHTYLGVNSMVGEYNYVSIDENISISYDTLIGGSTDEE